MRAIPLMILFLNTLFFPACQPRHFRSEAEFASRLAALELWQEAYDRWESISKKHGKEVYLLNNMAVALEALGRLEEAADLYKEALEMEPGNQQVKSNQLRLNRIINPEELKGAGR